MLQITPQHRVLLAVNPVDFRKGIESLKALCEQYLDSDAFSGTFFVFRNRADTSIKILVYDGNGFWLCQKRFSQGKLKWWPSAGDITCALSASELQIVLSQGEPKKAGLPDDWRKLV
ncbi:MAG: IS66 family insertion sequence hypothetical protein [Legionellales bacterium]|nr:IS66 family insertion sequence hypothetical protein [Legionellales bacterium]|tara:strand:- start:1696 stop:2046 length:351 start_codon:yes stop_codon:yes gene_type:complete